VSCYEIRLAVKPTYLGILFHTSRFNPVVNLQLLLQIIENKLYISFILGRMILAYFCPLTLFETNIGNRAWNDISSLKTGEGIASYRINPKSGTTNPVTQDEFSVAKYSGNEVLKGLFR